MVRNSNGITRSTYGHPSITWPENGSSIRSIRASGYAARRFRRNGTVRTVSPMNRYRMTSIFFAVNLIRSGTPLHCLDDPFDGVQDVPGDVVRVPDPRVPRIAGIVVSEP